MEAGTINKFPIPGISQPGAAGDAAPGSLLSALRHTAAQEREHRSLTLDLPGRWKGLLRARYGTIGLDEMERFTGTARTNTSEIGASLELLSQACKAIEAYDRDEDRWLVLEDDLGPVTFDDRLARLLAWPRPDPEFTFSVRDVYDTMFDGNAVTLGEHTSAVAQFMGLTEEDTAVGEGLTGGGSTPSAQPQHSG